MRLALFSPTPKVLHEHPTRDDEEMSSAFRKWCPPPENFPASAFLNMSLLHPPAEVNNDLFLLPLRNILNQVEHIGMRTLHHVDFDDVMHKFMRWLHLFGSLYSVQIVNIRLNSIPSAILLDILHPKSDGTLPFPALRSLVLPYFDLEIAIGHHELMNTFNARATEQLHAWDRNFNVLGRALQARHMLRKPLSQLVLHECSGASTKAVTSMLQRVVKELVVTWNAGDSDMEMGELEIDIFGEGIVSSQVSFVPQDDF
ncbi:hypothetical protein DL96DRAFT_279845 [Flagelloscypha sp. PMI_526]|nr:hypothetical protein DL96DRAFT_279845 [Flagelloscypha sp. PMI_526]